MISKKEWEEIENDLAHTFVNIKFTYKGVELSIERVRITENKTALAVYIEGKIGGGWGYDFGDGFYPLVEEVWRKRTKAVYPPSRKKEIEKIFGKRSAKKHFSDFDKVATFYDCFFNTAKSLVRQYKKLDGLALVINKDAVLCS